MKYLVTIIYFILLAFTVQAQLSQQESLMEQANQSYSSADYNTAYRNMSRSSDRVMSRPVFTSI